MQSLVRNMTSAVDASSNGAEAVVTFEGIAPDMVREHLSALAQSVLLGKVDIRDPSTNGVCAALTWELQANKRGHEFSSFWSICSSLAGPATSERVPEAGIHKI